MGKKFLIMCVILGIASGTNILVPGTFGTLPTWWDVLILWVTGFNIGAEMK